MGRFFPVSLNIDGRLCIIIGGGNVAVRRAAGLLDAGAQVKIIAPNINSKLAEIIKLNSSISWVDSYYNDHNDLKGASLVFAATNNSKLNLKVKEDASLLGIFTNIASDGKLSDFIIPSTFDQGALQVSISTSGKVPGLSKAIKANLEPIFSPEYKSLIDLLEAIRSQVLANPDNKTTSRYILSDITANYLSILDEIRSGTDLNVLHERLQESLNNSCLKD